MVDPTCEYYISNSAPEKRCGARANPSNPGYEPEGLRAGDSSEHTKCPLHNQMQEILAGISG